LLSTLIDSALWITLKEKSQEEYPSMEIAERILLVVGAILYFVPTVLAWWMHVKSARAIFYVNLVFGWTIVGWIVAVMWAMAERNELPTNSIP
jgi:Superinfection immunity protein